MAQALCQNVPSFCLACMGTNNKFTAEGVLKLWTYIFFECKKLGISVVSFGADGDPQELKAMQVSTQLLFYEYPITSLSSSSKIPKLVIPSEWKSYGLQLKPPQLLLTYKMLFTSQSSLSRGSSNLRLFCLLEYIWLVFTTCV